jgi:hypothetical protein
MAQANAARFRREPRALARVHANAHLRGSDRLFFGQAGNGIGHLCAFTHPILQAIRRDANVLRTFFADWVIETEALNEAAITTIAGIGNDDIEKRRASGAAT